MENNFKGYTFLASRVDGLAYILAEHQDYYTQFKTKFDYILNKYPEYQDISFVLESGLTGESIGLLNVMLPNIQIELLQAGIEKINSMSNLTARVYGWEWNDFENENDRTVYFDRVL